MGSLAGIDCCSRPAPAPAKRYWTPRWRDVAWTETLRPFAMREWRNRDQRVPDGEVADVVNRIRAT